MQYPKIAPVLFVILPLFFLFNCEKKVNPLEPPTPLRVTVVSKSITTFINDTTILKVTCDNENLVDHYLWLGDFGSDTSKKGELKKSWIQPGIKKVMVWAFDESGRPSNTDSCAINVQLGKPTVTAMKTGECYIFDTLSVSASGTDINGKIRKFIWKTGAHLLETSDSIYKFCSADSGKKILYVKVIDDDSVESSLDSTIITVNPGTPVITALRDTTCFVNDSIKLTAHASDRNGRIVTYLWATDSSKTFTSGDSISTFFSKTPGLKHVMVKAVDDDSLETVVDTCVIVVREGKPTVQLMKDTIIDIRDTLLLTASHFDTNGTVTKYIREYDVKSQHVIDTLMPGPFKMVWSDTGKKIVVLRAIDDDGICSSPDTCVITVGFGAPPTVVAMRDTSCYIRDTLMVTAVGTNHKGTIKQYLWAKNNFVYTDTTVTASLPTVWSTAGMNIIRVKAVNSDGQMSNPDSCNITVKQGTPIALPVRDTTVSFSSTVLITLQAVDTNLNGSMTWYWDTGAPGWDDSVHTATISFTRPSGGILPIVWAARDDDGLFTQKDTFTITFNRPPTVPTMLTPGDTASWYKIDSVNRKGDIIFKWNCSDPDGAGNTINYHLSIGLTADNLTSKYTGMATSDTITDLKVSSKYFWRLTAKDTFGDSSVSTGSFVTNGIPASPSPVLIVTDPPSARVAEGQTVKLWAVSSLESISYQWQINGINITAGVNDSFIIPTASFKDTGHYRCIVTKGSRSDTSSVINVCVDSLWLNQVSFIDNRDADLDGYYSAHKLVIDPNVSSTAAAKVSVIINYKEKTGPAYSLVKKSEVFTISSNTIDQCVIPLDVHPHGEYSYEIILLSSNTAVDTIYTDCKEELISEDGNLTQVIAGFSNNFIVKSDGTLWASGSNDYCQIGNGSSSRLTILTQIMTDISKVSAGYYHSLFLKNDGSLWTCGKNDYGQLGDGTTMIRCSPYNILNSVKNIAAGNDYSLILKNDSTLWACGSNIMGQLGDGTMASSYTSPKKVLSGVIDMAAGTFHSLALKNDGTAWVCGYNRYGQLGDGTVNTHYSFFEIMSDVQSIAVGYYHSLFVKKDGTLWGCGLDSSGQIGTGTPGTYATPVKIMDNVKSVSTFNEHSLILKKDNTLWACGKNNYGQIGNGTTTNQLTPVQIMSNVESMSAGYSHSLIIKKDGTIWGCGSNVGGILGSPSSTPVQIIQ